MVGHVVIEVPTRAGGPVAGMRGEEAGRRVGDGGVGVHEVKLGTVWVVRRVVGVVGRHENVLLVLVGRRVCGGRLHGLGQPGEVELVSVSLAVHLGHDVLVIVVAQGSAQFVVVHVGLGLALPPAAGHLVRVHQLELAVGALPRDAARVGRVRQQLQQELPQLDLARPCKAHSSRD